MLKDTRWQKILKDIRDNLTRTVLVVISIAVGVFAVGMVANARVALLRDLDMGWSAINPSSATVSTTPFQEALEQAVDGQREISQAEARRTETGSIVLPDGTTDDIVLIAVEDFEALEIDTLEAEEGQLDPGLRGITIERMSAVQYGLSVGDIVSIEMRNEDVYQLPVVGIIHDMQAFPPYFGAPEQGYVTMETLQWMGEDFYYNQLRVITEEEPTNKDHVINVLTDVRDRVIEPSGVVVGNLGLADVEPATHWATDEINTMILILSAMGLMSLVLSAGLVGNTINAVLTQQIKQIGIMRSVGAPKRQIAGMYLGSVLIFSLLALFISVPLGMFGALGLSRWMAGLLNFDITGIGLPPGVLALQAGVGVMVPILASAMPILRGTRISVYDAIYQQSSTGVESDDLINRFLKHLQDLPRPLMLSLRNTFRQKTRLIATIVTLTLAGMTFIGVLSTRASLLKTLEVMSNYWLYDVWVPLPADTDRNYIEREARRVESVNVAEGWVWTIDGSIVFEDDTESEEILVMAPPQDSVTYNPLQLEGRFLQPGDTNKVVVNVDLTSAYPEVEVGKPITLNLSGNERTYDVVGVVSGQLFGPGVYMTYEDYTRATNTQGKVNALRIRANPVSISPDEQQDVIAKDLEGRLETIKLASGTPETRHSLLTGIAGSFDIIVSFLMVMAVLLAVVGGLGLAGTMSINVLERTREIGVLRAVGASNRSVRQVVLIEGLIISMISWILGTVFSLPFGYVFAGVVGRAFLNMEPVFQFSFSGVGIWLALVVLIAAAAGLAPAQRASQLTIREVLATE